jgi:hypothetical protein
MGTTSNFFINSVSNEGDGKPTVVLFVGCLAKHFQGTQSSPINIIHHLLDVLLRKK